MKQKYHDKKHACSPSAAPEPSKRTIRISLMLIALVGFLVYANTLTGQFVWDDKPIIVDNAYIRSISHLPEVFTQTMTSGSGKTDGEFYRPLQSLTYTINYAIGKLDVRGYHLTNILFHILAACGIFWLIQTLTKDMLLARVAGLLFVVHPLHTEAVSYISGRADPMVAFFIIAGFLLYLKIPPTGNTAYTRLMLLSFTCGLLSKEYALILPFLLLVYHAAFKTPVKKKPFLFLAGTAALYLLLRTLIVEMHPPEDYTFPPLIQRIPGIFIALVQYLKLLVIPYPLHMEYGGKLFPWTHPAMWMGLLVLGMLILYPLKKRNSHPWLFFSVYWFLVALIPYSNLYTLNAYMAEHWLYLPSVGFFLIIAKGLCALERSRWRLLGRCLALALFLIYSGLTLYQNRTWSEPARLYEWTLRYAPDSSRVNSNLGIIYHKEGKREEAVELFKKALSLDPKNVNAYGNLGNAYRAAKKYEEAADMHRKVIEMRPLDASGYNNLGTVYYDMGQMDKALQIFQKAVKLNPNHERAWNNIGLVYGKKGSGKEAISMFNQAIRINPRYGDPYYALALVYFNMGNKPLALEYAKKARALGYPVHPTFFNTLASDAVE